MNDPASISPPPGQPAVMPPFSGDEPTCPKCGNAGATTRYLAFGSCSHGSRECNRCAYAWDEATVKEPAP